MSILINSWDGSDEDSEFFYKDIINQCNNILDTNLNYYVKIDGSSQRWDGTRNVDNITLHTNLEVLISNYINADRLVIEIYDDNTIEVINYHHDGTNRYSLSCFDFSSLTKKKLLCYFNEHTLDDYNDYHHKQAKYDIKDNIINFISDYLFDDEGLLSC